MSSKIVRANKAVLESQILERLQGYSPAVVSTIFVGLDTSDSDIDIVCGFKDAPAFETDLKAILRVFHSNKLTVTNSHITGQFNFNEFLFEVYGSTTPTKKQFGYRHYKIMERLVTLADPEFTQKIKALKQQGLKTEPAICTILGIDGNPYTAILAVEEWSDEELKVKAAEAIQKL